MFFIGTILALFGIWASDRNPFYNNEYSICSKSGNIYTVDETKPQVECISIRGSRISYTGSLQELQALQLQSWMMMRVFGGSRVVSYVDSDAIVVPGLSGVSFVLQFSHHNHTICYRCSRTCNEQWLRNAAGARHLQIPRRYLTIASLCAPLQWYFQEVLDRVKAYIHSHPDIYHNSSRWIEGGGWDQTKWPETRFPNTTDFDTDPLLKGRPIALQRVSNRVLEIMGDLPENVEGGSIIRDSRGNPTGVFLDNAMSLIPNPEWTDKQMATFFETTMNVALSYGLTSIHDAGSSPNIIRFMQRYAEAGNIPMRLYVMGHISSDEYWGSQISRLVNYGKHGRLTIRSVKLVTDGALGSWGAALLEPYSDKPDTTGIMRSTPRALSDLVNQFWKDGWQVNIHCIGDRVNHVVLDIFQDLIEASNANVTEWRPRIEHAQIMTQKDLERAGKLGIITSVQPTHATSDMWYAETRLGFNRIKGAYAYRTLLDGSPKYILPLGSDFPVESVNPLLGFYAAVSRLSVDGTSPHGDGGWYASEALTRAQALKGMTLDAAYASFTEHELGSLTPGKKADFVVLDRNIMQVPFQEILETKVVATVVDGKVAYGAL
ncbi:amidohydrolase family-domain-containing protein [Lentinula aciculospora]|uniref:Amidohydrolase family-domain-containing protein n=1 Tax=Lentinula aciculospora TaxID=153920 RepID=A0A9W9AFY1_9AGAR|nr:amidohydrolase family-domain-containing protein [Lentinula aciculospora]